MIKTIKRQKETILNKNIATTFVEFKKCLVYSCAELHKDTAF